VNHHLFSINDSHSYLDILKNLYETHSKPELIQLMVNLFNLELKNDDPMYLTFEIKDIMNKIDSIGMKTDLPITNFIKTLYSTYSHYLEYLQASGYRKSITFDKLVEKFTECEKSFGNKSTHSTD
jgi:hypothetical protein